jgi:ribonuclease P/MRP protein subunit RPP1
VVISSGAERTIELRGPYDLVNLGLLFGLKPDQSKAAVSKNIRSLLYHAEARNKTVKAVVSLEKMPVVDVSLKRAGENVECDVEAKKAKV